MTHLKSFSPICSHPCLLFMHHLAEFVCNCARHVDCAQPNRSLIAELDVIQMPADLAAFAGRVSQPSKVNCFTDHLLVA